MLCSLVTQLKPADLDQIKQLERELSTPLLAFSCVHIEPAHIEEEQLARIKELEEKLRINLVAIKP